MEERAGFMWGGVSKEEGSVGGFMGVGKERKWGCEEEDESEEDD